MEIFTNSPTFISFSSYSGQKVQLINKLFNITDSKEINTGLNTTTGKRLKMQNQSAREINVYDKNVK